MKHCGTCRYLGVRSNKEPCYTCIMKKAYGGDRFSLWRRRTIYQRFKEWRKSMAIRVIKHGTKRVAECAYCGCVFEYELEDVKSIQKKHNEYTHSVYCPDCRQEVETSI